MPQVPTNAVYYNGFYYSIEAVTNGSTVWEWIVYDSAGFEQTRGTSASADIARSSAVDWIEGTEPGGGSVPDWVDDEIAVGEEASYSNDYSGYDCASQKASWNQTFITLENVSGEGSKADLSEASSLSLTMPSLHKMQVQMSIRARHASIPLDSLPYSENVNVALEGGDSLEVTHDGNDLYISLVQDGREVISRSQLNDLNVGYLTKSVSLSMQSYQVCTLKEDTTEEDEDGLSQDDLWMILGLVVLTLLVGYVFSTSAEGN